MGGKPLVSFHTSNAFDVVVNGISWRHRTKIAILFFFIFTFSCENRAILARYSRKSPPERLKIRLFVVNGRDLYWPELYAMHVSSQWEIIRLAQLWRDTSINWTINHFSNRVGNNDETQARLPTKNTLYSSRKSLSLYTAIFIDHDNWSKIFEKRDDFYLLFYRSKEGNKIPAD